jgi:hypothetical protein
MSENNRTNSQSEMQSDNKKSSSQTSATSESNSNGQSSNNQFPLIRKRRDAFRLLKVHEYNGHEFIGIRILLRS